MDDRLVVVSKPSGWLVHRTRLAPGAEAIQDVLERQFGQSLHPAHRLDRATSGILLFARDRETASRLGAMFRARTGVTKTYLALVRGWLADEGEIDKPLKRLALIGTSSADAPELPALTRYRTLSRIELPVRLGPHPTTRYSLLEVQPVTGRTHQIRRHFVSARHPLVGDTVYGEGRHNRYFRTEHGFHRLGLHAWKLQLRWSPDEPVQEFQAPLSGDFLGLIHRLGWGFSG